VSKKSIQPINNQSERQVVGLIQLRDYSMQQQQRQQTDRRAQATAAATVMVVLAE